MECRGYWIRMSLKHGILTGRTNEAIIPKRSRSFILHFVMFKQKFTYVIISY